MGAYLMFVFPQIPTGHAAKKLNLKCLKYKSDAVSFFCHKNLTIHNMRSQNTSFLSSEATLFIFAFKLH